MFALYAFLWLCKNSFIFVYFVFAFNLAFASEIGFLDGEVGGDGGFAGTALDAAHGDDHGVILDRLLIVASP